MSIQFSVALILGAFCTFVFILYKIRRSEIKIADSTFWFLFAVILIILALFPQIAYFFSDLMGIESPANFIFLCAIAAVIIRNFYLTVEVSQLRNKLTALIQSEALKDASLGDISKEKE